MISFANYPAGPGPAVGPVRGGGGVALDPSIVAYAAATGITAPSASKLNALLSTIRAAGVEPLHLWVGGSDYNQANQRKSIIGSDATLVGAGTYTPVAHDAGRTRFNRGKYFRFDMPASLLSANIADITITIWFQAVASDSDHEVFNVYESAASRGTSFFCSSAWAQSVTLASSAGASHATMRANIASVAITSEERIISLVKKSGTVHLLLDLENINRGAFTLFNNNTTFELGGNSLTATAGVSPWALSNIAVHGIMIASSPASVVEQNLLDIGFAPYKAGTRPAMQIPSIVMTGDSTTAGKWPKQFCDSWGFTNYLGGAWVDRVALRDFAIGGVTLSTHIDQTAQIKRHLMVGAYTPNYFFYTYESFSAADAPSLAALGNPDQSGWNTLMENWLLDIEATTGASIVLASYLKGNNNNATAGQADRDYALDMATRNGWTYVPLWEDPHARIATNGTTDPNGFYADNIHATAGGSQHQATIVAAALAHPYLTTTPRYDINNPPVITGTLGVGNVLTCSTGTASNSPTSHDFQWLRALVPISGATSSTYTQVSADQTKHLSCRVMAIKSGVSRRAVFDAAPVGPIP